MPAPPLDPFSYLARSGIKPGLERIRALLQRIGNPEESFRTVLVAGSNGKGTTAAALEAMLRSAGFRTGLFTSPHLVAVTERFRVNGHDARRADLQRFLLRHRGDLERTGVTYFEATTACALWLFRRRQVEWAILEIGLGGRWDACNAVDPRLAVVTSISLEHTEFLGRTAVAIAREKAQVARPGRPVIVGRVSSSVRHALGREFGRIGANACWLGDQFDVVGHAFRDPGVEGTLISGGKALKLRTNLLGVRALDNVALAAAGLAAVAPGFPADAQKRVRTAILGGARSVRWPARLEVVGRRPQIVLDVAHNAAAFAALADDWRRYWPRVRPVVVVGLLQDKPPEAIGKSLARITDCVIITTPDSPRATPAAALSARWQRRFRQVEAIPAIGAAVQRAIELAGPRGGVLVSGSHFVVGPARAALGA